MSSQSEQHIIPKHNGRQREHIKAKVLKKTVAVAVAVIVVLIGIVAADS